MSIKPKHIDRGIKNDIFRLLDNSKIHIMDSAHPDSLISSLIMAYAHDRNCSMKACRIFAGNWIEENNLELEE